MRVERKLLLGKIYIGNETKKSHHHVVWIAVSALPTTG
jgi:hypothetical protein